MMRQAFVFILLFIPSVLLGTKADLLEKSLPPIDAESIEKYQDILNTKKFFRTSSKSGLHIKEGFKEIVRQILKRPPYNKRNIKVI